jgi:2',3'-cyclic-nucleotide 2'-phosphodiesterase / 3'-nucleotidase
MVCKDKKLVINILQTSDVHGTILPISYANNEAIEAGLAKISTVINREREKDNRLILIDNGDIIQGTALTYHYSKIDSEGENPVIKVMNYMKYDAAVLGNHEFNYGQDILERAVKGSSFPWLSANIVKSGTDEPRFGMPYIIRDFNNGLRAAVLGITTSYIPNWESESNIKGLCFKDVLECAQKWVDFLRYQMKVGVMIVSYHGGFERNLISGEPTENLTGENVGYELCKKIRGIDVLLTGHQHRQIHNVKVDDVLVVQPGYDGKSVAKVSITMEYDSEWNIVDKYSELISVKGIEADREVIELMGEYENRVQQWLDTPIGTIKGDMTVSDPMKIRVEDNPLIEFINRVQMETSKVDISVTALFHDKAPGLKAGVTMRDIVANYIYPNTLKVLKVKGKDIKEALERSASYFETYNGREIKKSTDFTIGKTQPYNYDMWEGIEYKINISKPIGSRVVELKYKGSMVGMDQEYEVVMNNYRASGGGEYHMFKGRPVVKDIQDDVAELIANFILQKKVIKAQVDGNWKVVHD